ncbi:GP-PDE domain-containing protein [Plasmodiophora brassicae]|uniref:Menorin-like domain-containing protein n=1 Tax=Plasmodiophora brassicae TaxID=37360 RepID=A0A0G4IJR9_PLABS|nr:hypothetical protein PBRA_004140 [Plasmodiophora brassicae]SPR00291.1 unnamed protein product [Plasmodiophora brassicae]
MVPADVSWSHATNTLSALDGALASSVAFIEADLSFDDGLVFMAHDPDDVPSRAARQDAAFPAWMSRLLTNTSTATCPGVKLDFKSAQAVHLVVTHLETLAMNTPVWLNADVLVGPRGRSPPAHDARQFIRECLRLPSAVPSLGWTTGPPGHPLGYTSHMIDEMTTLCKASQLMDVHVTFPVRAVDALAAPPEIHRLLDTSPFWTVTVWCGPEGANRDDILNAFDPRRTYVDVHP